MNRQPKSRRQSFFASVEAMERREVLSGATVEMVPGSLSQTILPYQDINLAVIQSTEVSVARDINNHVIDFNKDGLPDLLNMSTKWVLNGGAEALEAGQETNPLLADGTGKFELTKVNGQPYVRGFSVAVLDWNGDGNQDYLSISPGAPQQKAIEYYIFQNDGHGVFSTAIAGSLGLNDGIRYSTYGDILCMADFNSDGALI